MDGFEVDVVALRSAAGQVAAIGTGIGDSAATVTAGVRAGTAPNSGYETSIALDGYAKQLVTAMREGARATGEHGRSLSANADGYRRSDAENAEKFRG